MNRKNTVYGVLIIVIGILILVTLPYVRYGISVSIGAFNKKVITKEFTLEPLATEALKINLTKGDSVKINVGVSGENDQVTLAIKNPIGKYLLQPNTVSDGYQHSFEASDTGSYEILLTNLVSLFPSEKIHLIIYTYPYGALIRNFINPMFSLIGLSMIIIGLIIILIMYILRRR